jgi:hypothetical protein
MPPRKTVQKDDEVPQVIALQSAKKPAAVKRVELFSIDGEVYSVPTSVSRNVGLKYVHIARKEGPEAAADYMLESLLGQEGYEALINFEDLSEDDLKNIVEACSHIMVAASKGPKA